MYNGYGIDLGIVNGGFAKVTIDDDKKVCDISEVRTWRKLVKSKESVTVITQAHQNNLLQYLRFMIKAGEPVAIDFTIDEIFMRGHREYTAKKIFVAGYYYRHLLPVTTVYMVPGGVVRAALGLTSNSDKKLTHKIFVADHLANNIESQFNKLNEDAKDAVILGFLALRPDLLTR